MPESSTAMPTPAPSSPCEVPLRRATALPVLSCSRLAERLATRLGTMAITSLRAARPSSADAGTMPARARTLRYT